MTLNERHKNYVKISVYLVLFLSIFFVPFNLNIDNQALSSPSSQPSFSYPGLSHRLNFWDLGTVFSSWVYNFQQSWHEGQKYIGSFTSNVLFRANIQDVFAAVSRVQSTSGSNGFQTPNRVQTLTHATGISFSQTTTPTQGNINILVTSANQYLYHISSISQTNVSWSNVISLTSGPSCYLGSDIWIGTIGASASKNITINETGGSTLRISQVAEYSGVTSTVDQTASAFGSGVTSVTGTTSTTTQANELWIGTIGDAVLGYTIDQSSPTNGFTMFDGVSAYNGCYLSNTLLEKVVTSTGTASSGTTNTGGAVWYGIIATFKAKLATNYTLTFGSSPTNSNDEFLVINTDQNVSVTSISQIGATWSSVITKVWGTTYKLEIWDALNISGATTTVTINLSGAANSSAYLVEYSGLAISNVIDKNASSSGSSTTADTGTTAVTIQNSELFLAGLGDTSASQTGTPGNGFTRIGTQAAGSLIMTGAYEKIVSSTGTANTSSTISASQNWGGAIVTIFAFQPPVTMTRNITQSQSIVNNDKALVSNQRENTDTITITVGNVRSLINTRLVIQADNFVHSLTRNSQSFTWTVVQSFNFIPNMFSFMNSNRGDVIDISSTIVSHRLVSLQKVNSSLMSFMINIIEPPFHIIVELGTSISSTFNILTLTKLSRNTNMSLNWIVNFIEYILINRLNVNIFTFNSTVSRYTSSIRILQYDIIFNTSLSRLSRQLGEINLIVTIANMVIYNTLSFLRANGQNITNIVITERFLQFIRKDSVNIFTVLNLNKYTIYLDVISTLFAFNNMLERTVLSSKTSVQNISSQMSLITLVQYLRESSNNVLTNLDLTRLIQHIRVNNLAVAITGIIMNGEAYTRSAIQNLSGVLNSSRISFFGRYSTQQVQSSFMSMILISLHRITIQTLLNNFVLFGPRTSIVVILSTPIIVLDSLIRLDILRRISPQSINDSINIFRNGIVLTRVDSYVLQLTNALKRSLITSGRLNLLSFGIANLSVRLDTLSRHSLQNMVFNLSNDIRRSVNKIVSQQMVSANLVKRLDILRRLNSFNALFTESNYRIELLRRIGINVISFSIPLSRLADNLSIIVKTSIVELANAGRLDKIIRGLSQSNSVTLLLSRWMTDRRTSIQNVLVMPVWRRGFLSYKFIIGQSFLENLNIKRLLSGKRLDILNFSIILPQAVYNIRVPLTFFKIFSLSIGESSSLSTRLRVSILKTMKQTIGVNEKMYGFFNGTPLNPLPWDMFILAEIVLGIVLMFLVVRTVRSKKYF